VATVVDIPCVSKQMPLVWISLLKITYVTNEVKVILLPQYYVKAIDKVLKYY
jgi:hypothetical protein